MQTAECCKGLAPESECACATSRIAELEAALREIKTRTYAYRGDDQNFPLAAGVYEVASHALQKSK